MRKFFFLKKNTSMREVGFLKENAKFHVNDSLGDILKIYVLLLTQITITVVQCIDHLFSSNVL